MGRRWSPLQRVAHLSQRRHEVLEHLGDAQRFCHHLTEEFKVGIGLWMGSLDRDGFGADELVTVEGEQDGDEPGVASQDWAVGRLDFSGNPLVVTRTVWRPAGSPETSSSVVCPAEDKLTESPVAGLVNTCFTDKVVLTSPVGLSEAIQMLTRASYETLIACPVPQKSGSTKVATSPKVLMARRRCERSCGHERERGKERQTERKS